MQDIQMNHSLVTVMQESLRLEYLEGAVTDCAYPGRTPWRHLPCAVILHSVKGAILLEFNDGDAVLCEQSQCVVVPPDVSHRFRLNEPGYMVSAWAHIQMSIFASVDLTCIIELPRRAISREESELSMLLSRMIELTDGPPSDDLLHIATRKELSFRMLTSILKIAPPSDERLSFLSKIQRLLPVLTYIKDNLSMPIRREELARLVYLSESRFHVIFKDVLGEAPLDYVKRLRLKKARYLLASSDDPIYSVAEQVGYGDQFHFSRIFKAACGVSPLDYRRRAQELFGPAG